MVFGRVFGWFLAGLSVIMASADAVMALGPADYAGIITADVVTLLSGAAPDPAADGVSTLAALFATVLDLPAWVVVGLLGITMSVVCRKRPRTRRLFASRGLG